MIDFNLKTLTNTKNQPLLTGPFGRLGGNDRMIQGPRIQPLRTFACVLSCKKSSNCPEQEEAVAILKSGRNFNQECIECLTNECGMFGLYK